MWERRDNVLVGLAAAALALVAPCAHADAAACIVASEKAQQERGEGMMRAALDSFRACSVSDCPAAVRSDCAKSYAELDATIPSVVVIARDPHGKDLANVRVLVDGELLTSQLDGRGIRVDPGLHAFRVEVASAKPLEQRVLIHEGEKDRVLRFLLPPPADASPVSTPSPDEARQHTAAPWVLIGIGVAAVGAGVAMFVVGKGKIADSMAGCNGAANCDPSAVTADGRNRQTLNNDGTSLSNVGLLVSIGGGVAAIVGVVWHFLEPTGPKRVSLAPWLAPGLAGTALRLTF